MELLLLALNQLVNQYNSEMTSNHYKSKAIIRTGIDIKTFHPQCQHISDFTKV